MKNFLNHKLTTLFVTFGIICFFLLFTLLGIAPVVYDPGPSSIFIAIRGEICYPISGGFFVAILVTWIVYIFSKHPCKKSVLISFIVFGFLLFGTVLAMIVLLFVVCIRGFTPLGAFVMVCGFMVVILSFLLIIICAYNIKTLHQSEAKAATTTNSQEAIKRLKTIKELLDKGFITEEEYQAARDKYIKYL